MGGGGAAFAAQRAAAVVSSNTPGGDGSAVVFDVAAAGCQDVAGNLNPNNFNIVVTEAPDVVRPVVKKAFVDLSTGTFVISTSETLDLAIPSAEVDLTKLYVANGLLHSFTINSASYDVIQHVPVTQNNGYVVWTLGINSATITEAQGIPVTQLVTGATGTLRASLNGAGVTSITVTSAIGSASFTTTNDVVLNGGSTTVQSINILTSTGLTTSHASGTLKTALTGSEFGPTTVVEVSSALGVVFDATTPLVLNNGASTISGLDILSVSTALDRIVLTGATVEAANSINVTITMTESQRVRAIQTSGEPGGDSVPTLLDGDNGALNDLSSNVNRDFASVFIDETQDSVLPVLKNATLNLSTGILIILGSETLDALPKTLVDLTKMRLSNVSGSFGSPGTTDVILTGASVTTKEDVRLTVTSKKQSNCCFWSTWW